MLQTPFTVYCGSTYLNILPMPIDGSSIPQKIHYTPDLLPDAIYVTSGNYVSNFNTPSESPQVIIINHDSPETDHIIMIDKHGHATEKI